MHCHVLGSVDLDYKTSREGSFLKPFSYTDVKECQTGSYTIYSCPMACLLLFNILLTY